MNAESSPARLLGGARFRKDYYASRIFISYRREDSRTYARLLFKELESRYGRDAVFMDVDSLRPGVDFPAEIERVLSSCDIVLALIGPGWSRGRDGRDRLHDPDDYVRHEVAAALKARSEGRIAVIPVLVPGAVPPAAPDLPADLAGLERLQALKLSDDFWGTSIGQLARAVDEAVTAKHATGRRPGRHVIVAAAAGVVAALVVIVVALVSDRPSNDSKTEDGPGGQAVPTATIGPAGERLIKTLPSDLGTPRCDIMVRSSDVSAAIHCEVPRGGEPAQARVRGFTTKRALTREAERALADARSYVSCGGGLPRTFERYIYGRWLCSQTPTGARASATVIWTDEDRLALAEITVPANPRELERLTKRLHLTVEQ